MGRRFRADMLSELKLFVKGKGFLVFNSDITAGGRGGIGRAALRAERRRPLADESLRFPWPDTTEGAWDEGERC